MPDTVGAMNERVPDSSGLPLRAMVMVLLFLGIVFLLVGFQALGSSGGGDDDAAAPPSTAKVAATSAPERPKPPAERAAVQVYNISEQEGVAGHAADRLREAGWNVTDVDNLELPGVTATTVYFGETADEHEAAGAVGELLHAPVEPRLPELADKPPGVIVAVAG